MKIPQHILDQWRDLQQHRNRLVPLRDRLRRTTADATREFTQTFLRDKVFVTFPELHRQKVQREHEAALLQQRQAAVGVGLYSVERPLQAFEPQLRTFKQAAMRAPGPLDAWMSLTGGQRKLLDDHTEMLAEVAHEQRLTRLLLETKDWQPSRWRAEYQQAVEGLTEATTVRSAASFIQFAESKHGGGWAGPSPVSTDEEEHAVSLRKLIGATQAARIPPEVGAIETALEDLKKIIGRTRSLDRILPRDPDRDGEARAAFEAELVAQAAAGRE